MITDFQAFGAAHIVGLVIPLLLGSGLILWGLRARSKKELSRSRLVFAALIIAVRGARYLMDLYYGVFTWDDLLSLHICHVDLILLVICLVRPNSVLFHFCFLLGIPFALSVALLPGSNHPAPGLPRAILFIMSHALLVLGALYLAVTHLMKPTFRSYLFFVIIGNVSLIPLYLINKALGTNYLYIMEGPEGTVIASLEGLFGWPGYVLALDALAVLIMLFMVGFGRLLWKAASRLSCRSAKEAQSP
jgi:hypothetical integral membrane protein (TIGR02206 family)